jgi:hypothetical protein
LRAQPQLDAQTKSGQTQNDKNQKSEGENCAVLLGLFPYLNV